MNTTSYTLTDGQTVALRSATAADAAAARSLVFDVLIEYGLQPEPNVTDGCMLDIEANYVRPGGLFNIITTNNRIVGCYGLMPRPHRTCELRKMYLHKDVRGHGLGNLLMQRAIDEARTLGFSRIELDTASCLREAIALYRKFGFKDFHHPHIPQRCDMAMALDL